MTDWTEETKGIVSYTEETKITISHDEETKGTITYTESTAIDIGSEAINRTDISGEGYTDIQRLNPANATGKITTVEIWSNTDLTSVKVAIFYVVSGDNLSTRSYQTIGTVIAGAKRTFSVNLDVVEGDYIGMYWVTGNMEADLTSDGQWYRIGDAIPCTNLLFTAYDEDLSLHGTTGIIAYIEEEKNKIVWTEN